MNLLSEFRAFKIIKLTGGVLLIGLGIKCVYSKLRDLKVRRNFEIILKQKLKDRESQFEEFRQNYPMSPEYQNILSYSLPELRDELSKGELSAEDVLKAYISKAMEVQDELNCIISFIPMAMEKAKALDDMHMVKGPLHGIPFCINDDTIHLEMTQNPSKNPPQEFSYVVQCLINLGAIPFCRTNSSQAFKNLTTKNHSNIFGKVLHPLNNKQSSPEGFYSSNCGTASLVTAGGSLFGIGTDVIGSLRISAHFCGISTIKPTEYRISSRGLPMHWNNLSTVPGVLAKRAQDTALVMQALTDNNLQNSMDGKTVPISWNTQVFESKQRLRIGYFTSLLLFPSLGDTESVVLRVKMYLESAGHILVPFEMQELLTNVQNIVNLRLLFSQLNNNNRREEEHNLSNSKFRTNLADQVLDKMKKLELDLILCPVFPTAAINEENLFDIFNPSIIYTLIWNLINFPAGVIKVWTESGKNFECSAETSHNFGYNFIKILEKGVKESKGMPIGVQIVGKPFQEEVVLRMMVELDEINDP